ncbi:hypothetical protein [Amantichitinum ursilacus]|uniref:CRISPR-associated nuclease/helicase Cas3 subtype I-F/YPEST n=1 Tax=Amantichitinum ursilacus TaxID=857265 RepID=A0A0N0GNW0_9NEIS|nr:hypothetical protein [Amantichitinum ursilacus]KPC53215.1 CRISPR-associated nuclease/helicase Cas3 subtype I-F/YPEST [Amantichitinum ursilacus]
MHLLGQLLQGKDWPQAWSSLQPALLQETGRGVADWQHGIRNWQSALAFIVASHHKLPGPLTGYSAPDGSRHVPPALDMPKQEKPELDAATLKQLAAAMARLAAATPTLAEPELYWRGLTLLARAALILADHSVSAIDYQKQHGATGKPPYANTKSTPAGARRLDQPLNWHLQHVAQRAADYAWRMHQPSWPGLSPESAQRILAPADTPAFAWQDQAVRAISTYRQQSQTPLLVLNVAGTGSGKTRANAKMACALRDEPRFVIALNLRTLTLQTGEALRTGFGIGADELATVIGDQLLARLAQRDSPTAFDLDDEDPVDVDTVGADFDAPAWTAILTHGKPRTRRLLAAPILVSTVDFIIHAGNPGQQARHVQALLRLQDSDLVLDELDSYDPPALIAVLRVVQMAALLGRNVICASATLAEPVASAVQQAFAHGLAMRAALHGEVMAGQALLINDRIAPQWLDLTPDFNAGYREYLEGLLAALPRQPIRLACLAPVPARDAGLMGAQRPIMQAIVQAVSQLHAAHAWPVPAAQKSLTFGLVRIANVVQAIEVARVLADALPHAQIACYHANDFMMQRYLKEQRLDYLLTRKGRGEQANAHTANDPLIRQALAASSSSSVPFIVVATPVEEVGRDHDFDWAVIEPSSVHSIVQTVGRVNRHRQTPVSAPNVALLQRNFRWARGLDLYENGMHGVFCLPGLEPASPRQQRQPGHTLFYSDTDLQQLLGDDAWLSRFGNLDARLRFDPGTPMAADEDRLMQQALATPLAILLGQSAGMWMSEAWYRRYALRERDVQDAWHAEKHAGEWRFICCRTLPGRAGTQCLPREVRSEGGGRRANAWLSWSLDELAAQCEMHEVDLERGLSVMLRNTAQSNVSVGDTVTARPEQEVWRDASFGFYLKQVER